MASSEDASSNITDEVNAAGPSTNNGGKVKQTRKRQRLSCVECTKRRQKCDRQFPCGLCTSRGIPHLCHWEPHVVRPAPQRPPTATSSGTANATIEALSARIAALEDLLTKQAVTNEDVNTSQTTAPSPGTSDSASSTAKKRQTSEPSDSCSDGVRYSDMYGFGEQGPRALIDYNVQVAAVALAQLSLAPRLEFVGHGTVLCALHKLGDPESWRFPYSTTSLTSPITLKGRNTQHENNFDKLDGRDFPPSFLDTPMPPGRRLVRHLPPRPLMDELVYAFFSERNWQFGLSERWFRSCCQQMWTHLELRCDDSCRTAEGCPACKEDINPHWLSLLYSVLALAPSPRNTAESRNAYFMHALAARRFMDDTLLSSPAYSTSEDAVDGGVLSCIAATFIAMYLAERGSVSEAWKLVGSAVRSAQALGMQRDPSWGKWEAMHKVERELRILGWWSLMISDRLWSWILGRPPMVNNDTYDVVAEVPQRHADGSPNNSADYINAMIRLSEIMGEAAWKCFGPFAPPYARILETDNRFQDWELQLPENLHWKRPSHEAFAPQDQAPIDQFDSAAISDRALLYQRHSLAAWYYGGLMNLHRPYVMHSPPILPPPGAGAAPTHILNPSRDRCIEVAITMTRVLCSFHDRMEDYPEALRVDGGVFTYFTFDGAVACAGALSQVPPHPKKDDCLALMDRVIAVLQRKANYTDDTVGTQAEVAKRGIVVLKALKKAAGWDMNDDEKGELVLLQDMLKKQKARRTQAPLEQGQTSSSTSSPDLQSPPSERTAPSTIAMPPNATAGPSTHQPSHVAESRSSAPFIPYLHPSVVGMSSGQTSHSTPPLFPAPANSFADFQYSDSAPNSWTHTTSTVRPNTQSMVMPFEVLQGVQPTTQTTPDIDLNWARLAGMDSWFSGNTSTDHNREHYA